MTPREQVRSQRLSRRLRPLALAAMLGALAVSLSGCSWSTALGMGWPEGITPEAHLNRELWVGAVVASLVVGTIVWGLIFWTATFHRKKATDTELPRQFGYNMPLELVLTVTPFLIISVLFYFTVVVQEKMLHLAKNPEVVIDVTAFQWNWKFGYQRVDLKDGSAPYDGSRPRSQKGHALQARGQGRTRRGARRGGARDATKRTGPTSTSTRSRLWEPAPRFRCWCCPPASGSNSSWNRPTSIHAFWVPEFLFKRDVMPNPIANNSVNVFQVEQIYQDRRFCRPLRRDVWHLSLDDEFRSSGGVAQRLQGLLAAANRAERPTRRHCRRSLSLRWRPPPTPSTPAAVKWPSEASRLGHSNAYRSEAFRVHRRVLRLRDGAVRGADLRYTPPGELSGRAPPRWR